MPSLRFASPCEIDLKEAWQSLWHHRGAEGFQSPEWHRAWWETQGGFPDLATCWDGKDLTGVLPLTKSWGKWKCSAASVSDSCEPLVLQEPFPVGDLPRSTHLSNLRWSRSIELTTSAIGSQIDLPDSWDAYEQTLGSSLRQDLRRSKVCIQTYRGCDATAKLETLVQMHRARWRSRCLPGAFTRRRAQFHHRFLALNGPGRLLVASQGGVTKGVLYLLEGKERWSYYQAGILPEKGSHGSVLIAEAIRQTIDAGVPIFDFLRGTEPYKRRWRAKTYPLWKSPNAWDPLTSALNSVARSCFEDRWSKSVS